MGRSQAAMLTVALLVLGTGLAAFFWPERDRALAVLWVEQERVEPCPGEAPGLPLAYGQELARLARESLPASGGAVTAHVRRGPERGRLRLELEGPPGEPLAGGAQAWQEALLERLEYERTRLLGEAAPSQRDCLARRLFVALPPGHVPPSPKPVGIPWLAVSLGLLVGCGLAGCFGRQPD